MSLCQIDSYEHENAANYSYIISADGLFQEELPSLFKTRLINIKEFFLAQNKENRHFTTPPALGSYYYNTVPFLYQSGFAQVNGKMLFFGGGYDKKMVKIAKTRA